jgi:hypothetical protein
MSLEITGGCVAPGTTVEATNELFLVIGSGQKPFVLVEVESFVHLPLIAYHHFLLNITLYTYFDRTDYFRVV